jgi:mono/diheme cytochrome c family protein
MLRERVKVRRVTRRRSWAIAALTAAVALGLTGLAVAQTTARPGNAEAGRPIFKKFCARCHNFMANGTRATAKGGVTGSDLDVLKPRYSRVVTAIVQGEGGLPAEYFLARLTFQQIYDVAAYVAKYAGRPGAAQASLAKAHR